ncbi:hypothetical protein GOP47_0024610 [Adiantum capillus-veneris]|uniref:Uncharacterized protein n=1 Tax=Adiantum capillus-veneris TaxID=13818 RepID=A0A9D4Z3T4_ADICA|nr:hypothetical protein GOP47_0024610 [Adiantum capillus-veneris]
MLQLSCSFLKRTAVLPGRCSSKQVMPLKNQNHLFLTKLLDRVISCASSSQVFEHIKELTLENAVDGSYVWKKGCQFGRFVFTDFESGRFGRVLNHTRNQHGLFIICEDIAKSR